MVVRTIKKNKTANDVIYTPLPVALKMIQLCNITPEMSVLDPCKGAGVFYNNLPSCNKDWCEITDNKDFFNYTNKIDLIIGNPPYSLWNKWLEHTMKLTDKFCYIMGFLNLTPSRLNKIMANGFGITYIHMVDIEWYFGMNYLIIFEKNKPSIISVEPKRIYCDICGTNCKRGKNGNSFNICSKQKQTLTPFVVEEVIVEDELTE